MQPKHPMINPIRLNKSPRTLVVALLALASLTMLSAQSVPAGSNANPPGSDKSSPLTPANTADAAAKEQKQEEAYVLSPFEVKQNNKGYYSANTMSGTRFNTKLDDLASSLSVMSKEQMQDFAMLDANDVFLYMAGTEGTHTFTDFTLDRNGSIADNTQLNPTQANRIRGMSTANMSLGNIETMGRVPVDPIALDAIEVSRGPNANVFGLGNPSGTVNMVPAAANMTRNFVKIGSRADSFGGRRLDLDANYDLIKNKLAFRISGVKQYDGYELKPSGFNTNRYDAMVKYQPFKNTTISGSIFSYKAWGNRPNSIPPRDNLSYWIASGRPTWDPITQQIHINGATVATVTAATYNGPDYFSASYLGNDRNQMYIDQTGMTYWAAPRGTTSTVNPTAATLQAARYLQPTAAAGAVFSGTAPRPFGQPLFNTTPTISDKNIYDWSSLNLATPNYFIDNTVTSNVQLEQMFVNTPTQTLAAQAAFMRENSDRLSRNIIGTANDNGQSGQLTVDINERLLDGSPNPYFLRPYIGVDKPRTVWAPQQWDTARAQLAYRLDLTKESGLLKHLGWFQATAYGEYKYRINRQYSYRDAMISNPSWLPAGTYHGFQSGPTGTPAINNLTQGYYKYYVGDKVGNNVDYAPGSFQYGNYPFIWGNAATGAMKTDTIALGQAAADKSGGTFNSKVVLKTVGSVLQSHLFDDRLVTTLGARYDQVYTHFGATGNPTNAFLQSDGVHFDESIINGWSDTLYKNGGRTTNVQFVARPFAGTKFVENLDRQGGAAGQFMSGLFGGMSVFYNTSNSFQTTTPAQDLYKNLLPNPHGTDRSYGIGLSLFDGKVGLRVTHYDDWQRDSQTNDMSTMAGRVLRMDYYTTGAGNPTPFLNLYSNAMHWVSTTHPTWTNDQVTAEVETETKISAANNTYYTNAQPPIGATADVHSFGNEMEINMNPTRYWTVSASVTDQKTVNANISKALVNWINDRMPIWTTLVDPTIVTANAVAEGNPNKLWWLHKYSAAPVNGSAASYAATAQTPQANYQAFVQAPFGIIQAQEGKASPQTRRYNFRLSTRYQLAGITENPYLKRVSIGGAIRWMDKAAIGYYGLQSLPATITDLDPNRPIFDKPQTALDLFASYRTKLWDSKTTGLFQVNIRNFGDTTRLLPVSAFPDGSISTYRIADPQQIIVSLSLDL